MNNLFLSAITKEFKRYPWFVVVGVFGVILNISLTYLLTEIAEIWYFLSFIIATLITWTTGFFLNSKITFRGHEEKNLFTAYIKFLLIYCVFSIPAFVFVYFLTSVLEIQYLISVVVINIVMSLITFLLNKRSVFKYN